MCDYVSVYMVAHKAKNRVSDPWELEFLLWVRCLFHNDANFIVCLGKDIVDTILSHVGTWEEGEGSQVQ